MPERMERALKAAARKKFGGVKGERARKYIYGRMRKAGWRPLREKKGENYY